MIGVLESKKQILVDKLGLLDNSSKTDKKEPEEQEEKAQQKKEKK
jgi:hypothetical protein